MEVVEMPKLINLTGQKFGHLLVLEQAPSRNKHVYWKCQCDCGNITEKTSQSLRNGAATHCGCQLKITQKKDAAINRYNKYVGQKFGKLTVIANTGKRTSKVPIWLCQCDCGNFKEVPTNLLTSGHTQSCGCLKLEKHLIDLTGKKFGKLTVLHRESDKGTKWICQCDCGNIKSIEGYSLRSGNTQSCGCINYSIGEQNIKEILINNNISFSSQFHPKDGYGFYDFAIFENNEIKRLIEFDGEQHFNPARGTWNDHEALEVIQNRDKKKDEYALSHNIPLIRIPYWMRDKITLDMLMGDNYLVKPINK